MQAGISVAQMNKGDKIETDKPWIVTLSLDVEVDELIAEKHARGEPSEVAAGDGNRIRIPGREVECPDDVDGFRRTDDRCGDCFFGIRVSKLAGRPAKSKKKDRGFKERSARMYNEFQQKKDFRSDRRTSIVKKVQKSCLQPRKRGLLMTST